jgi:hypothetical protein
MAHPKPKIDRVSVGHTEELRPKKSNSDPGHIVRRENMLQKNWRKRTDIERSGGEAIEELGGKITWHNHKKLESVVGNATVSTLPKLNCGSTCKRCIAGLFRNQAPSIMAVNKKKAVRIGLAHQKKIGPILLSI